MGSKFQAFLKENKKSPFPNIFDNTIAKTAGIGLIGQHATDAILSGYEQTTELPELMAGSVAAMGSYLLARHAYKKWKQGQKQKEEDEYLNNLKIKWSKNSNLNKDE